MSADFYMHTTFERELARDAQTYVYAKITAAAFVSKFKKKKQVKERHTCTSCVTCVCSRFHFSALNSCSGSIAR